LGKEFGHQNSNLGGWEASHVWKHGVGRENDPEAQEPPIWARRAGTKKLQKQPWGAVKGAEVPGS